MARRSEHSLEELKELVLEAAETIVIKDGFSALKVRRIAVDIGYTVGSVYMVFTNMADLIMHINSRTLDAIVVQLERLPDFGAEQSIEALAMTYLNYATQNLNRWHNIFDYHVAADAELPGWYQAKVDGFFARIEARFAEIAPELAGDHGKNASRALWRGIHGICALSLTDRLEQVNISEVEEMLVLLVTNFMRGWVARPDK